MLPAFSHITDSGDAAMVDVSDKTPQKRIATASGSIFLQPDTLRMIADHRITKGNVLTVAQIAGISAAKQTSTLIPLCHPLPVTHIAVSFHLESDRIHAVSTVTYTGVTGVEMEALTAVSVALLTIYDMCKAVDKQMVISDIRLDSKEKQ